jgi:hypothetical protein
MIHELLSRRSDFQLSRLLLGELLGLAMQPIGDMSKHFNKTRSPLAYPHKIPQYNLNRGLKMLIHTITL